MKLPIYLDKNLIYSNSQKAISLAASKRIGEKKRDKVIYTPYEAYYLVESNNATPIYKDKTISERKLIRLISKKDKEFFTKYLVYKELREKGYIPKTALKFGADFRIYKKSKKHAVWLCTIVDKKTKIKWKDFIAKNRIAHSTAKKLLIAIVDSEHDISYYEINWIKP